MNNELYDIGIGARVKHPTMGVGVVYAMDQRTVHIFFKEHGEQPISRSFEGLVTIAPGAEMPEARIDMDVIEQALREVLEEFNVPQRPVELANAGSQPAISAAISGAASAAATTVLRISRR